MEADGEGVICMSLRHREWGGAPRAQLEDPSARAAQRRVGVRGRTLFVEEVVGGHKKTQAGSPQHDNPTCGT